MGNKEENRCLARRYNVYEVGMGRVKQVEKETSNSF
jgi:hypothetical protein